MRFEKLRERSKRGRETERERGEEEIAVTVLVVQTPSLNAKVYKIHRRSNVHMYIYTADLLYISMHACRTINHTGLSGL